MKSWLIGSATDCEIVVKEQGVSGRHCRLTQHPAGFQLENLDANSGTVVNGQPITSPVWVTKTDTIILGGTAVLPWPADAQPTADKSAVPSSVASPKRRGKTPWLIAGVGGVCFLLGIALGGVGSDLPSSDEAANKAPSLGLVDNSNQKTQTVLKPKQPVTKKPKVGFTMGQFQASDPIKTIKVTIHVGENGQPLQEQLDLHLGFGFPLALFPVGPTSGDTRIAAHPHASSLTPGQNAVAPGNSASSDFSADPEPGLDELKTSSTLFDGLTIGDIHSVGFASKGDCDWELEGYEIEVNGVLYASNDSVNARAREFQSKNDAELRSKTAAMKAVEAEVKGLKELVDIGFADPKEKDALKTKQADLNDIKPVVNEKAGLVAGCYPWFQETDAGFKPTPAESPVKSVTVTLVTRKDKKSGSHHPIYFEAGGQKFSIAAVPDFLIADARTDYELDITTLKYDPISLAQIMKFALGMLGSDVPDAQVADRAMLKSVIVKVDGKVIYDSDKQEIDRETLKKIRLLPPVHRDDLGTPVENAETAVEWYTWMPGKAVTEQTDPDKDPFLEEPDRKEKENPFAKKRKKRDKKDTDDASNKVADKKEKDPFGDPIKKVADKKDKKKNPFDKPGDKKDKDIAKNPGTDKPDKGIADNNKLRLEPGKNLPPVRRKGDTPGLSQLAPIIVVISPPKTGQPVMGSPGFSSPGFGNPGFGNPGFGNPWSGWPGFGGPPYGGYVGTPIERIVYRDPPALQPPKIDNVRFYPPPQMLKENQQVVVKWDVIGGDKSMIKSYRVQLNPVLPHKWMPPDNSLPYVPILDGNLESAYVSVNVSSVDADQRKYLYVQPQVTAFDKEGNTINGTAETGRIVPVSTTGTPEFTIGPTTESAKQYQLCGNGFGPTPGVTDTQNKWTPFRNPNHGREAWQLTSIGPPELSGTPLSIAPFDSNVGTRSSAPSMSSPAVVPRNEKQILKFTNVTTGTAGDFTLNYDGLSIGPITYDTTVDLASKIESVLNKHENFGDVAGAINVRVSENPAYSSGLTNRTFEIEFQNHLEYADLDLLTATHNLGGGATAAILAANVTEGSGNEVQRLSVPATSSSKKLNYYDATTGQLATATVQGSSNKAANVQLDLENCIPALKDKVKVVGRDDGPFYLVFHGDGLMNTNVPQLFADTSTSNVKIKTISNGGQYLVVRYDARDVDVSSGKMHVVAHLGFIGTPSAASTSDYVEISARVNVAALAPDTETKTFATNQKLQIDTTRFKYYKQAGGPMQLIDIPIELSFTQKAKCEANCQISGRGPKLRITPLTDENGSPAATAAALPSHAFVSVTFEIRQTPGTSWGSEGVGIFGVRLVSDP